MIEPPPHAAGDGSDANEAAAAIIAMSDTRAPLVGAAGDGSDAPVVWSAAGDGSDDLSPPPDCNVGLHQSQPAARPVPPAQSSLAHQHPEEPDGGETPGSIVASVNQASIEEHVDEGASEVAKQGADLVISVTEAYDESTFATSEVTQEAVVGTAEGGQKSLDAVAEVESSLVDTAATDETNGDGLDSASCGNTIVKEANPHSEGHGDTIEKTPGDDTNKKMAVDDEPSDLTGGDIKLGLDVHSKILKLEDEPAPPDMKLHSDHEDSDAVAVAVAEPEVAVAEPEDDTSQNMIIDDVLSGLTHTNVELGAKVDCKIEQEGVSTLFDATALHAYPKERIVAAAKGLVVGTAEASQRSLDVVAEVESSLVNTAATDETNGNGLDSTSSGNTIVKEANPHSEGHGDTIEKTPEDDTNKKMAVDDEPSDLTGGDIKLGLDVHSKILKLEDEPAPPDMKLHSDHEDSDAVAVAEPEDDTGQNMIIDDVPSGLTHTNVELGAKVDYKIEQEGVSTLLGATALHAYPKERIVAAAKDLVVGTAEASQRSLDVVAEVESSLVDEPQPAGQQRRIQKRKLTDDKAQEPKRSKLQKSEIKVPVFHVEFIPLVDFLSRNQLTTEVSFPSGLSSIIGFADTVMDDKDYDIENTQTGEWLADGFITELVTTHQKGLSWGGQFAESDMFVAKIGKFVYVSKEPSEKASLSNKILDFDTLANTLFSRYGKGKRKPPYLGEFFARVGNLKQMALKLQEQDLKSEEKAQIEFQVNISLWILAIHPFFMAPIKFKALLESYYTYYKSFPNGDGDKQIRERNRNICGNWHVKIVRKDKLLRMLYWSKDKRKAPSDYMTRDPEFREGDNDFSIYPFTPADGYLAVFLRSCFVHGPQIIQVKLGSNYVLTVKEMLSIMAHYFEDFIPAFLEDIAYLHYSDSYLAEVMMTYTDRATISWRALSAPADTGDTTEEKDEQ